MDETKETNASNGTTAVSGAPPDLSGAIERILANPELISTVAAALGKAPPSQAPSLPTVEEAPPAALAEVPPPAVSPEALATLAPLLSGLSGFGKGGKDDPRICLLRALKPYLSASRCETIDTIIRFSAIGDALQSFGKAGKGGH